MSSLKLLFGARGPLLAGAVLATAAFGAGDGLAQDARLTPGSFKDDVFVLGGRFHDNYFQYGFVPFLPSYEDNYLIGVGYQHFFLNLPADISFGAEVGVDARFGSLPMSAELWGGFVARYDGLTLGNVRISPALTLGLSAETGRVQSENKFANPDSNTALLFYIGPELNFSFVDHPNTEVFWRIQHRSGAWNTIGDIGDGANATTVGVRFHF